MYCAHMLLIYLLFVGYDNVTSAMFIKLLYGLALYHVRIYILFHIGNRVSCIII